MDFCYHRQAISAMLMTGSHGPRAWLRPIPPASGALKDRKVRFDMKRFLRPIPEGSGPGFGVGQADPLESTDMIAGSLAVLERLSELAAYTLVLFEPQGRVVLVNATAEEIFGYPRDESLGLTVDVLLPELFQSPPRDADTHPEQVQPDMSGTDPERELYARRKNGSEIAVACSVESGRRRREHAYPSPHPGHRRAQPGRGECT